MQPVPTNIIESPFTDEQQVDLRRYQACKTLHPYTCPDCSVPLEVSSILFCPGMCGYTQEWARTEGLELAKLEEAAGRSFSRYRGALEMLSDITPPTPTDGV